jgi:hypothetical protein
VCFDLVVSKQSTIVEGYDSKQLKHRPSEIRQRASSHRLQVIERQRIIVVVVD